MQNTLGRSLRLRRKQLGYPPSEEVLRAIARCLEMDEGELLRMAGRLTEEEERVVRDLVRQYPGKFVDFLKTLNTNAEFAQKILTQV